MPGQHDQPTPTSLGQGCMRVWLQPATRNFGRMTGVFLRATAVTRGVEGTPNKSQHTKLTLEKKILPPLLPGFKLATFRPRVRRS